MAQLANEVKLLQTQKEVESLRRKLLDATHEKKMAISRLNKEWDQKFSIERDKNSKKWEVERQELYLTLETNLKLAKDKDVLQLIAEKDREMRRMRDNMNYERDNAIRVAKANTEEKYRNLIKQSQEDSRERENSLTKEINVLSKEKESLQERVSSIRKADLEKANAIKHIHYSHEKTIKELTECMKQDAGEEYKRYRALEQYAHDKESEVNKLNSKILRLDNDKEILEKQIATISKFGEMHGSSFNPILAPKVLSNREIELARKVRELEKELQQCQQQQQQQQQQMFQSQGERQNSLERGGSAEQALRSSTLYASSPYPPGRPTSEGNTNSPTPSPSAELEERLKRLQEQRRQLKELVTDRDQQAHQLEQRNKDLSYELDKALGGRDEAENRFVVERETYLMEHSKQMDELNMHNNELEDKLQECSDSLTALRNQLIDIQAAKTQPVLEPSSMEEEVVLLQNQLSGLEKKYKRVHKESLATESLFSQWCAPDQAIPVDSNDKIMQLELDLGYTRDDLREALEQVDAFQIRNEKLKIDYQKSRNDVDRLICQREKAMDEKKKAEETEKEHREAFKQFSEQISHYSNLDKELKNQKEKHIKTKESLTSKIEYLNKEIERLHTFEVKALQVEPLKRELELLKNISNGNSASPPTTQVADELIIAQRKEISGLKNELNILEQVNKKKDRLIKQLDSRESPNGPKLSTPTFDLNSSLPRLQPKLSQSKISPIRHTSSSSSSTSSQVTSYDDSYQLPNNVTKQSSPHAYGSLTLPRPVKSRPKLFEERIEDVNN